MTYQTFVSEADCDLPTFADLVGQSLDPSAVPQAIRTSKNVPVYSGTNLSEEVLAEWAWVLGQGPGVFVIEGAMPDLDVVDRATDVFAQIIDEEAETAGGSGDHFAAGGANARIWNALQKLCMKDPETFALYFGSPALAAAAKAWLGPGYQMTAQINLVRPGGAAQTAHRDYHLGFQSQAGAAAYPVHAHHLSAALTLQGAVAHCDMPVESGPTKLLPYSQLYGPGYIAYHLPDFQEFFEENCIQMPLKKGDAVFFNPALFHAAGANHSADIQRMANLLQVSSAFGRAMESVDRAAMVEALYPAMHRLRAEGRMDDEACAAAMASAAEGYAFPTNLDTNPPAPGAPPPTQGTLMAEALRDRTSPEAFAAELAAFEARSMA